MVRTSKPVAYVCDYHRPTSDTKPLHLRKRRGRELPFLLSASHEVVLIGWSIQTHWVNFAFKGIYLCFLALQVSNVPPLHLGTVVLILTPSSLF